MHKTKAIKSKNNTYKEAKTNEQPTTNGNIDQLPGRIGVPCLINQWYIQHKYKKSNAGKQKMNILPLCVIISQNGTNDTHTHNFYTAFDLLWSQSYAVLYIWKQLLCFFCDHLCWHIVSYSKLTFSYFPHLFRVTKLAMMVVIIIQMIIENPTSVKFFSCLYVLFHIQVRCMLNCFTEIKKRNVLMHLYNAMYHNLIG